MIGAFWFVTVRSFKNRVVSRLRRLREPRYLIGFIAGLAYIWFTGLKRLYVMRQMGHGAIGVQVPTGEFITDCLALAALFPILIAWALPDQQGGLVFSEAEIQFLFPAPVSRRQLLIYKILRQQPPILISALAMSLFGFGSSRFVGLWLAFVTLSIYFTTVGLARARLKLAGIGFLWRLLFVIVALAGLGALLIHTFTGMPHLTRYDSQVLHLLDQPLRTPAFRVLLFIPRLFAAAVLPVSLSQLALACAGLAILAFVLMQIAGQLNVSFEDAAIHAAIVGKDAYLVLSPPRGGAGDVRVLLDGHPIADDRAGADVHHGVVRVDRQRLYHLVSAPASERHVLTLRAAPGIQAYAFTFG